MKKKIFTLLTLGFMLSNLCLTVNAQSAGIDNTKYSHVDYWPKGTVYADVSAYDVAAQDSLYTGCEYTLTVTIPHTMADAVPTNRPSYMYFTYPLGFTSTLPDSIQLIPGEEIYRIPFVITSVHYDDFRTTRYTSTLGGFAAYILNGYAVNTNNDLAVLNCLVRVNAGTSLLAVKLPSYSFSITSTDPSVLTVKAQVGYNTLYSLDGGKNWVAFYSGSGSTSRKSQWNADTTVYTFSSYEVENMTQYILLKEPNSCHLTNKNIFDVDYPHTPSPTTRPVVIDNDDPNIVTSPGSGQLHYVVSQRNFDFFLTLTGANTGLTPSLTTSPDKHPDGSAVLHERVQTGPNSWYFSVKQIRSPLNVFISLAVGNEAIAGTSVWADAGQVFFTSVAAGNASIYSATGALVKNVTLGSGETVAVGLPAGFYVAVINGQAIKFIIK